MTEPLNYTPPCDAGIGSTFQPYAACALFNYPYDTTYFMHSIGSTGEMEFTTITNQYCCQANTLQSCPASVEAGNFDSMWSGACCHSQSNPMRSPDNGGAYAIFTRNQYNGDPLTCCIKNNVCNSAGQQFPSSCYSDQDKQNTCDPKFRDATNDNCVPLLKDICIGKGDTGTTWLQNWTSGYKSDKDPSAVLNCRDYIDTLLTQTQEKGGVNCNIVPRSESCQPFNFNLQPPSPQGYSTALDIVNQAVAKYNEQGFKLGSETNSPSYTAFQDVLKDLCCKYPSLCFKSLESNCLNVNKERLKFNPVEREWCGCYLPDADYKEYTDVYGINRECTPYCNMPGNIPLSNPDGTPITCRQNVCLIDDVTVSIINSDVGTVNIGQFCGGCQSQQGLINQSSCTCIIDNSTVDIINTQIGGQVNIGQSCGNPICTKRATKEQVDAGAPPVLKIPCDSSSSYDPFSTYVEEQEKIRQQKQAKVIGYVLITIFILLAIWFLISFIRRK